MEVFFLKGIVLLIIFLLIIGIFYIFKRVRTLEEKKMNLNEEVAKELVCKWLIDNGESIDAVEPEPFGKKTFPDYMVRVSGKVEYLEVTSSSDGALIENGKVVEASQYESPGFLSKQYEQGVKKGNDTWIKHGDTMVVIILSPIPQNNRGKLARRILKIIKELYLSEKIVSLKQRHKEPFYSIFNSGDFSVLTNDQELPGLTLNVSLTTEYKDRSECTPLIVSSSIPYSSTNRVAISSLRFQAQYILSSTILKKDKKVESLGDRSGEMLLVIHNSHPILSKDDYLCGMKEIEYLAENSNFKKIFLIDDNECYLLWKKSDLPE